MNYLSHPGGPRLTLRRSDRRLRATQRFQIQISPGIMNSTVTSRSRLQVSKTGFVLLLFLVFSLEIYRYRVYAVAESGRFRSILEHVT